MQHRDVSTGKRGRGGGAHLAQGVVRGRSIVHERGYRRHGRTR